MYLLLVFQKFLLGPFLSWIPDLGMSGKIQTCQSKQKCQINTEKVVTLLWRRQRFNSLKGEQIEELNRKDPRRLKIAGQIILLFN